MTNLFRRGFDSIPHERLLARVAECISDGRVLSLIDGWLEQDIVHDLQRRTPIGGTPHGAVLSPLLANIYLHPLDQHMLARGYKMYPLDQHMLARGYKMVRYADDFVVLCQSAHEAQQALAEVQQWVSDNGLELNMDKTQLKDAIRQRTGRTSIGTLVDIVNELNRVMRANWRAVCGRTAMVASLP